MFTVVANQDTFVKKILRQSSELTDADKQPVVKGEDLGVESILEETEGHIFADLQANSGKRWFFKDHWHGWPTGLSLKFDPKDTDAMARTIYGESRGESKEGKIAIGWVILNRWMIPSWWSREVNDNIPDDSVEAVCKDPWQFSCWNKSDPNYNELIKLTISNPLFKECLDISKSILAGEIKDPTNGSDHYYAFKSIPEPKWAKGKTPKATIGGHKFYDLVEATIKLPFETETGEKIAPIKVSAKESNVLKGLSNPDGVQRQFERLNKYAQISWEKIKETKIYYAPQRDNLSQQHRTCNTSSNAAYTDWLLRISGKTGLGVQPDGDLNDDNYFRRMLGVGDSTSHEVQSSVIRQYGISTKWMADKDLNFVLDLLKVGFPVVVNIFHRSSLATIKAGGANRAREGHIVYLIGINPSHTSNPKEVSEIIYHDPYGSIASNYSNTDGKFQRISVPDFLVRWQGGYRILA